MSWFSKEEAPVAVEDPGRTRVQQLFAQELAQLEAQLRKEYDQEYEQRIEDAIATMRQKLKAKAEAEQSDFMADIESDIAARLSQRVVEAKRALDERYGADLAQAREEAQTWQQRAAQAEDCVRLLVAAVLPEPEKAYALGRFCRVTQFPLQPVNAILRRTEMVITAELSDSDHAIECQTEYGPRMYHLLSRGVLSSSVVELPPEPAASE